MMLTNSPAVHIPCHRGCPVQLDAVRSARRNHKMHTLRSRSVTAQAAESKSVSTPTATPSLTERMFTQVDSLNTKQAGGAGGSTTYNAFKAADAAWTSLRNMQEGASAGPAPTFVREVDTRLPAAAQYDVAVCGGTLGIFLAAALAKRGLKVVLLERGPLVGRAQEWNISRKEMVELIEVGILTHEELESVVRKEFNPVRVQFAGNEPVWTKDVLNLGVSPQALVALMKDKFESFGGTVLDRTALSGVTVHPNGTSLAVSSLAPTPPSQPSVESNPSSSTSSSTSLSTSSEHSTTTTSTPISSSAAAPAPAGAVTARLIIDCMGHNSPVVKQMRWGRKPDGVCLVVGGLGSGFQDNTTGDVIRTNSSVQPDSAPVSKWVQEGC